MVFEVPLGDISAFKVVGVVVNKSHCLGMCSEMESHHIGDIRIEATIIVLSISHLLPPYITSQSSRYTNTHTHKYVMSNRSRNFFFYLCMSNLSSMFIRRHLSRTRSGQFVI